MYMGRWVGKPVVRATVCLTGTMVLVHAYLEGRGSLSPSPASTAQDAALG